MSRTRRQVGLWPPVTDPDDLRSALDRLPDHLSTTRTGVVVPVSRAVLGADSDGLESRWSLTLAPVESAIEAEAALEQATEIVIWRTPPRRGEFGVVLRRLLAARNAYELPTGQAVSLRRSGRRADAFPRLLVIDPTRTGGLSATGQLKRSLLHGWPEGSFMQVHGPQRGYLRVTNGWSSGVDHDADVDEAYDAIEKFQPQVVYYRPILDQDWQLHRVAERVRERLGLPFVVHVMDDWPGRLAATDRRRGAEADRALRQALGWSTATFSISEKMSTVYSERYGVRMAPLANGVDPTVWAKRSAASTRDANREFVLRYTGGLATDMTFDAVLEVARSVSRLRASLPIRLEVFTMPWWARPFEEAIAGLRGVELLGSVSDGEYPRLLTGANALVLGYNFDAASLRYVSLSMPNKLPEYLASGTPVLAVGPVDANGISFARTHGLAECVTEPDEARLDGAVRRLATDATYRESLASRAQQWAFRHLSLDERVAQFQTALRTASQDCPRGSRIA